MHVNSRNPFLILHYCILSRHQHSIHFLYHHITWHRKMSGSAAVHLFKNVKPSYIIHVSNESSWKFTLELFLSSGDTRGSSTFTHYDCSSGTRWWETIHLSRHKVMLAVSMMATCHMTPAAHCERICWWICVSPQSCSHGWCRCFNAITECTVWTSDLFPLESSHWQAIKKIWSLVQPLY